MAKTTSWGFTNTSQLTTGIKPNVLNLFSEYSRKELGDGQTAYINLTSPNETMERITVKAKEIPNVKIAKNIAYPAKVQTGCQYSVQVEDILSTTDSADPAYRVDEPLAITLTIRHAQSSNITSAHVEAAVCRALGALYYADGSSRIPRLCRQSTVVERN